MVLLAGAAYTFWQSQQLSQQFAEMRLRMEQEKAKRAELAAQQREIEQIRELLAAGGTKEIALAPLGGGYPALLAFWNERKGVFLTARGEPHYPNQKPVVYELRLMPKNHHHDPDRVWSFPARASGNVFAFVAFESPASLESAGAVSVMLKRRIDFENAPPNGVVVWHATLR